MSAPQNYYAEVENHFVERRGSPLFITPKEWQLVAEWERAGVPLEVVREAIDTVFERPKTRQRRRTLAYCRQSVEASFRRFKEARLGAGSGGGESESDLAGDLERLVAMLERAAGAESVGSGSSSSTSASARPLGEALRAVAREIEALAQSGVPLPRIESRLAELDAALAEALEKGVDEATKRKLEQEAAGTLASYRARMPEDVYEAAVRSAFLRRLRATFGLSRLSLF